MKVVALAGVILSAISVQGFQDVRKNFGDHRVVSVNTEHLSSDIISLLKDHEGDHLGKTSGSLSVKLSPEGVRALSEQGVSFEDTTEAWINDLQANFDDPNAFCQDGPDACAARSMQDFYSTYQDLAALTSRIKSLVAAVDFADFIKIGESYEGRDMNVVEIGDQSKPLAYFMCNIHAREWLTPMYCCYMIENLLANGGHELLDHFSFAIIPTGNPDGYTYSRTTNNMWRKTRNVNPGSTCIGTDPNRNYADHHCGSGTSNNPCSDIYCGPEPFSTPETFAINAYGAANADRLIAWNDYHSYAGYWLSPLGYAGGKPPAVDYNRMDKCMSAAVTALMAETGDFKWYYGPAADMLGAAAGASDDWFYFGHDVIYSFTVELRGTSFQPKTNQIDPSNREVFAGMVAQMECIGFIELGVGKMPATAPPTAAPCTGFFC